MDDIWTRLVEDAASRVTGPMKFRLLLIVATRFVYVGEAIVTAGLLAIAPYLLVRGLVTRVVRKQ